MRVINRLFFITAFFSLLLSCHAIADPSSDKGLEIAKERKARDRGWISSEGEFSMILRNARGQAVERLMQVQALEVQNDGDKALTVFKSPSDVKGSSFLSYSHALEADEQWIYLPAVKRVKRIASQNKSGPFMASEFAFEDMTSFEVEKFAHKLLREETYKGSSVFVVEQIPKDEFSGYSKQILWVDKAHYRVQKAEFYDKKNALLKVLEFDDYKLYKDKFWRPTRAYMDNVQTGKSTELVTHSLSFDVGLKDSDFDESSLRRAR